MPCNAIFGFCEQLESFAAYGTGLEQGPVWSAAPVLVYLILSQNVLHESLQKLILRFVAGLLTLLDRSVPVL